MSGKKIGIMDTTLRDGEQSPEGRVNYSPSQKLTIAQFMLGKLKVDRLEVTSAKVSDGEHKMLKMVMDWARKEGLEDCIEVLGFVDNSFSVNWLAEAGCKVMNLLCKGSRLHCESQLKMSLNDHLHAIGNVVDYALSKGITVNVYLEDWSWGMIDSPDYVQLMVERLSEMPINRIMLCDTRGVLNFWQVAQFIKRVSEWTSKPLDFHGHDDYGLATANVLAAVMTGYISDVHVTMNGMGERAGNSALEQVVVGINDHCQIYETQVQEGLLREAATLIASNSGRRVAVNSPMVGGGTFTNTAGIHAHGGSIYEHPRLKPARFGAVMTDNLGKLAGKGSVRNNLSRLGYDVPAEDLKAVTAEVVRLADEGRIIDIEDLRYILASVQNRSEDLVVFEVLSAQSHSMMGGKAITIARVQYKGKEYTIRAYGDGGFDAFMNALRELKEKERPDIVLPKLVDYDPTIPPGGASDALVQATIVWRGENGEGEFQTFGLDSDVTMASIKSAAKAINVCNHKH